ncbi:UNVERIFIED_CONTAM: hypothetical protein PYX00_005561 [Menopon gallinae]
MNSVIEYGKAWLSKPILRWLLGTIFVPMFLPWLIFEYINYLKYKTLRKKLAGKVVMITGASSGLGEAFAHVFYKAGCKIILSSRTQSELARVRKVLLQMHKTTPTYPPVLLPLDLSDINLLPSKAQDALQIFGHIDILINNGGISYRGNVMNTDVDVDMKVMLVNYFGHVALTKAILPSMIKRKEGHIVVISSVQGLIGIPYRSAYAASKHALQGFFDCLRSEVGRHNINVTVVSPGYIKTKLSINALTGDGKQYGVMDPSTAGGYDPNEVAEISLRAILRGKKEIVISTIIPRALIILRQFCPWLYFVIMSKRAKILENA